MLINTRRQIIFFLLLCGVFHCCGYTDQDAKKHLPGEYFYRIPSGELQLLTINPDFSYRQIVYDKNKNVLYENIGKMYVDDNKIEFENWLECYELASQVMRSKPHIVYSMGNYWRKPTEKNDVLIIVFDQTNYILKKRKSSTHSVSP